ncbi:MAG: diacylglycerol kinase family lipid kinase [Elusimicrobia bacterium]|nr:diacylglycerol kinase family lipid kinase [Elusimicrobiota bacterium]
MKKYIFIINPKSGLKINKLIEKKIREKFNMPDIEFFIEYTKYRYHSKEIALNYIEEGFDNIIAVGGDGTIREIAGLLTGRKDIKLGIIPAGSGNGLARNLGIPLNIDDAIRVILNGRTKAIDCGMVNGEIFLCTCGTGFDAKIAYLFNNTVHSRGLLPYFIHGILSYFKFKPNNTDLYVNGEKYSFKPLIATIANGKQYGGKAVISPNSIMDDGYLEAIVIDDPGLIGMIMGVKTLFNSKILENDCVKSFRSKNFKIVIDKGSVYHLDGEDFSSEDGVLNISVMENAINVISV